ncbi:hypothetical protein [Actinoallomurus acanthiterrae]
MRFLPSLKARVSSQNTLSVRTVPLEKVAEAVDGRTVVVVRAVVAARAYDALVVADATPHLYTTDADVDLALNALA